MSPKAGNGQISRGWSRDPKLSKTPDYARVVASLTDAELEDEILGKRGAPEYQAAAIAEHDRRARRGVPS